MPRVTRRPGGTATPTPAVSTGFDKTNYGFEIILALGQSNVLYGAAPPAATAIDNNLDAPNPTIFQYPSSGTYTNRIIIASEPLGHHTYEAARVAEQATRIGFVLPFAKQFLRTLPTNRRVLILPCACPSAGFSNGRYNAENDIYRIAIARVNQIIALDPTRNKLGVILWHQGEADILGAATYAANLDTLINGIRAAVSNDSIPFIAGELAPRWNEGNATKQQLNDAIAQVVSRVPFTAFVPSTGLASNDATDLVHFHADSQRILGDRYFAAYLAIANTTIAIPPAPTNITVTNFATTAVMVKWQQTGTVSSWTLRYKLTSASTWTTIANVQNGRVITGLTPNTQYDLQILATNSAGSSAYSAITNFTTLSAAIAIPTPLVRLTFDADDYTDSSGNGRTGTPNTGTTIVTDPVRGKVVSINGNNQFVSVPVSVPVSYSKATWVYITDNAQLHNLISQGTTGTTSTFNIFWITAGTQNSAPPVYALKGGHEANFQWVWDIEVFPINTWMHVAITYDNATRTYRLYKNGFKVGERVATVAFTGGGTPTYFGSFAGNNSSMKGFLDNPAIWGSVLTDQQIAAIYYQELM